MITTFLTQSEIEAYTSVEDRELNELLQYARRATDNCILIEVVRSVVTRRLFRANTVEKFYTVYWTNKGQDREVTITNFYGGDCSINTSVPKDTVLNYLMGLLTGVEYGGEK